MKKLLIITIFSFIFIITFINIKIEASSVTYLYLDSIKIEDQEIEILSDEISIDTTTSKIINTLNLKNTSNEEKELTIKLPLENEELDISIKDLVIKFNDVEVEYIKGSDGEYIVKSKISANSGKKIDIEYNTTNNLQDARIIKCNFDNLKDRKVGMLDVNIIIDEKNIPLVEKIYPGHYTFNDNTISVKYYNFEVNTITKNVIVKKETFNNLLYGRDTELDDDALDIIKKWYTVGDVEINENNMYLYTSNNIANNILDYNKIKKYISSYSEYSEPLLYGMSDKKEPEFQMEEYADTLKGKKICIDFVETEGNKELYVEKTEDTGSLNEYDEPIYTSNLVKTSERTILQTRVSGTGSSGKKGAKVIFVGQGIDGESLNATEQEKISYINQINADLYIRVELYDGKINYVKNVDDYKTRIGKGMVGYYDDNTLEIARAFTLCKSDELLSEDIFNNIYTYEYEAFYSNYEEYCKNYYNDYFKDCLIKLDNDEISNSCEIPTVVQFIGNRVTEDGKYVVKYFDNAGFYDSFDRGFVTTQAALQTSQAQKMLSANKKKNSNIKENAENEIANLAIVDNEQEVQQSIKNEIEETKRQEDLKKAKIEEEKNNQIKAEQQKINNKHIMVFSAIGLGIFLCLFIIIIDQKRKRRKDIYEKK